MAFHTPITWDNSNVTALLFNRHLRDNMRALYHTEAIQSANLVKTTDVVLENLPGLTFQIKPKETWIYLASIFFVSNTTADIRLSVTVTGTKDADDQGANAEGGFGMFGAGAAITAGMKEYAAAPNNIASQAASALDDSVFIGGVIWHNTEICDVQIQGCQSSSSGTTTFYANSFLVAFRLEA